MELKQIFLSLGIAVLTVFFFAYALEVFYPEPKIDCYDRATVPKMVNVVDVNNMTPAEKIAWENEQEIWNQEMKACEDAYDLVRDKYGFVAFLVLAIIAIIIIIVSVAYVGLESVGTGLLGGGIIQLIYGTARFWGEINQIIRLLLMAAGLGILIWLGIKYIDKGNNKGKKGK